MFPTSSPSLLSLLAITTLGCQAALAPEEPLDDIGTSLSSGLGEDRSSVSTPAGAFELLLDTAVAGNSQAESLSNLWPLSQGKALRYYGSSSLTGDMGKLQIKVEAPQEYEGQLAWPVDFVKNRPGIYWQPDRNQNLRWYLVDLTQSEEDYFWARGDRRYDNDAQPNVVEVQRLGYESLSPQAPPYTLFPREIVANPSNSGLGNYALVRHNYTKCSGSGCTLQDTPGHVSWFMGVRNARIKVPALGDEPVDAKWVEFVEVSLPGELDDELSDPYSANRDLACRRLASGERYFRGVREDWFFVDGIGPALILQRMIGTSGSDACVYDVAREALDFTSADAMSYLIEHDQAGYDPSWGF